MVLVGRSLRIVDDSTVVIVFNFYGCVFLENPERKSTQSLTLYTSLLPCTN